MLSERRRGQFTRREVLKFGVAASLGLSFADVIAACGGSSPSSSGSSITMRLGSDSPIDATHTLAVVTMKRQLEAQTNGRIKCTIFPDGQLGDNGAMANLIKQGTLDAYMTDMQTLSTAVPEVSIFSLPFLFNDGKQALRAAKGATGALLKPLIETAYSCTVAGWGTDGERDMWNSKRPIRTPDDVKGLKMRTQLDQIQEDTYTAFGALPTPIAFTEMYTALSTGVVDGADNGPTDLVDSKFYEVTKYVTLTRHFNVVQVVVVSNAFLSKLSSADKDLVLAAAAAGGDANANGTFAKEASDINLIKTKGIQVFDMQDPQAFKSVVQSVYTKDANRVGGQAFIEQAQNTT